VTSRRHHRCRYRPRRVKGRVFRNGIGKIPGGRDVDGDLTATATVSLSFAKQTLTRRIKMAEGETFLAEINIFLSHLLFMFTPLEVLPHYAGSMTSDCLFRSGQQRRSPLDRGLHCSALWQNIRSPSYAGILWCGDQPHPLTHFALTVVHLSASFLL
jgi:hypothetical protein